MALSWCLPRSRKNKTIAAMGFYELNLAAFDRAAGKKAVFKYRKSLGSDATDVAEKAMCISTVVEIEDVSYLREKIPFVYSLRLSESSTIEPLASFVVPEGRITCPSLKEVIEKDLDKDDVLCSSFMRSVMLVTQETSLDLETLELLSSFGCRRLFLSSNPHLGQGPFFYSCHGIFRVFRLYPDTYDAFVTSVIPSPYDHNKYRSLSASAYGHRTRCVAVPSRLYYTRTEELPLAGLRLSVKDVFHLRGVVTTNGNRAYESLYGEQPVSPAAVQAAIDKGAIIVGKATTVEFAGAQEVEGDWADFRYPKNPRADGYLRATGSSVGSACGMAAYPWLDGSLGSDCGGSIRDPAVAFGVLGFRASHDGVQEEDTTVPCPRFQRTGYLARDMRMLYDLTQHAIRLPFGYQATWRPKRIITVTEYASGRSNVDELFNGFVERLATFLGIELVTGSLEEVWRCTKPVGIDEGFSSHYAKTFMTVDYQRTFNASPFVAQPTRYLWGGGSVPDAEFLAALEEVKEHNEWFSKYVLDENTIMVLPRFSPDRRDEYLPTPSEREWMVWDSNLHTSIGGYPNLMVPIGQLPFDSEISKRQEVFPVPLAITGPQGTDVSILGLMRDFMDVHGPVTGVQTGKSAFPETFTS
ncbi:amidase signature domain-containing protein [Xylariaceae sp. FL0594]|nr:amidase signature domain-containing protein [Xylariaceae sp. FL0594]